MVNKGINQRLRQNITGLLVLRPISAFGGLLVLIILSRQLPKPDLGVYFSIWAATEILILASAAGLIHAVYRYVSAEERLDGRLLPHGPVWALMLARLVTLGFAAALAYATIHGGATFVRDLIPPHCALVAAAIIFGEGLARFIEAIFDSMLSQHRSQLTLVTRTLCKVAGYLGLVVFAQGVTLQHALHVEAASVISGAVLGLTFLFRVCGTGSTPPQRLEVPARRMLRFAMPAYAAQLAGLICSIDAMKIALGKVAGQEAVALFGFAYSISSMVQRYLPANLLAGVFRPVLLAATNQRETDAGSTDLLNRLANAVIKTNWLFVAPILCALIPAADDISVLVSDGKYGSAGPVLILLTLSLLPVAIHLTLSMLSIADEDSWPVLAGTLIAAFGLPMGIILSTQFGAVGMALAILASEFAWVSACSWVRQWFRDVPFKFDYSGSAKILLCTSVGAGASLLLADSFPIPWYFESIVGVFTFLVSCLFLRVLTKEEQQWLLAAIPSPRFSRT